MMSPLLGSGYGFGPLLFLHVLSNVAIASGVLLLLAWAVKNLSGEKLKRAALWSLGIGLVTSILLGILAFSMAPYGGFGMQNGMMPGWEEGR